MGRVVLIKQPDVLRAERFKLLALYILRFPSDKVGRVGDIVIIDNLSLSQAGRALQPGPGFSLNCLKVSNEFEEKNAEIYTELLEFFTELLKFFTELLEG